MRQRLACGILAGLHALSAAGSLSDSLLRAVLHAVHLSLSGPGGGSQELRVEDTLSQVGRLPLKQLLHLHAFLALRMVGIVQRPNDLDRELQARRRGMGSFELPADGTTPAARGCSHGGCLTALVVRMHPFMQPAARPTHHRR